jgi:hypothetical protein
MASPWLTTIRNHLALLIVGSLATVSANAALLTVSFDDPIGDFANETIDLTGVTLNFDNTTGDYELLVTFDAANPYQGTFNVNANLLNGSIAPLTVDPAFVAINELPSAAAATTLLTFSGSNANLTSWNAGDAIGNDTSVFGLPVDASFIAFVSGVQDGGLGIDLLDPAQALVMEAQSVPEPATLLMLGAGFAAFGLRSRRRA